MKTMNWYAAKSAGAHHGIIADEQTGRTVGLTYNPADAPLVAAAPALLEALQGFDPAEVKSPGDLARAWEKARAAIEQATETF